ncbi:hypothetical protein OSCI_1000015 [Kamptonema sp. PCC 6506]|nr:hypothetical protein OSCI_1000015 [Kamptonema sp. PCC 6506]
MLKAPDSDIGGDLELDELSVAEVGDVILQPRIYNFFSF